MAAACKTRDLCRHRSTGGPPFTVQRHVAIEVPDLPAFHAYAAVCRSLGNREALPVMVSSREDVLGQRGRAALEGTSRSLMETGRPSPLFVHIFSGGSGQPQPQQQQGNQQ